MPDPIYDFATAVGARVEPTPSIKTSGAVPGQPFGAKEFNDLIGRLNDWVKLMSLAGADKFDIEHDSTTGEHTDITATSVTSAQGVEVTGSIGNNGYKYETGKDFTLSAHPHQGQWQVLDNSSGTQTPVAPVLALQSTPPTARNPSTTTANGNLWLFPIHIPIHAVMNHALTIERVRVWAAVLNTGNNDITVEIHSYANTNGAKVVEWTSGTLPKDTAGVWRDHDLTGPSITIDDTKQYAVAVILVSQSNVAEALLGAASVTINKTRVE